MDKGWVADVTVVIPAYNCARTIERAVASVAAQTYKPREVIVVDDASTDNTIAVVSDELRKHPDIQIRLIRHPENRGPAVARNTGWGQAQGIFIAFLDADDAWHPQKLEMQFTWMVDHPEFGLCGHKYVVLGGGAPLAGAPWLTEGRQIGILRFLISNQIATPTAMVRRDLPYRFAETKRYAEDYLLWLQIALDRVPVAYIDAPLATIYKPVFGASGLSSRLWDMETGELAMYWQLCREHRLSGVAATLLSILSLAKYVRRCVMVVMRPRPRAQ